MNFPNTPRWTRRQALWMLGGTIAGIGLHSCAQTAETASTAASPGTPGNMSASIGITTWIGNTPLYIAQEKGFFQELGLTLDIRVFQTVAQAFPAFTAGQLSAIAPVTSEVVSLAANGADHRVVMVADTSLGADVLLARNSIQSIADFRGKKIGVELGGIGHFFVLQVLAEAGLSEKDVELVNTPPDAAAAAYQTGSIEIAYSYSPYSDQANEAQKDGRTIYSTKEMPTAIADFYVFSNQFIQSSPQAVAAFVEGNIKGLEFLESNRDEGLAIMAKQLGITPEELDGQLQGIQIPDLAANVEMLGNSSNELYMLNSMNDMAEFLEAQGQIESTPDLSNVIDPQFVNALQTNG
ncbi:ABC transporter substrate-binding protein [Oculatella sp. LEGE 06141]|uniref:ABC transporter substrate-binding protein n=1 Tax=Oculatella sp. LEGE 06141 TaxID=1828648 RepID=UPI00187E7407|nr:ABC transporter substrate-binding protein [Oculatella sp. LEGE 06141]MBE9178859.1 ABC transporter substrate-binding protein [Oculatella sp. LEGE 06141]